MNYTVKESGTIHGFCPPGYERVASYSKKDGTIVPQHCRKVRVEGRARAAMSGLYNEGMIAEEEARRFWKVPRSSCLTNMAQPE